MEHTNKRLLVVDDEPQMCELVAELAGGQGFLVAQATNHADFERVRHEFRPTIIVMDLAMPDGDGIELLRLLSAEHSKVAIILMSGFDKKVLSTARQIGQDQGLDMIGVLQKPIMIAELEVLLSNVAHLGADLEIGDFLEALEDDQIEVFYQPKARMTAGVEHPIEDVEALVRWRHPEKGLLAPDRFLKIAEESNQMLPLTRTVAGKAFAQVGAWREKGLEMSVAVNIAPELLTNLSLPDEIADLARQHSVPSERVMLEITEQGIMEDTTLAMDILTRFRLKGFRISIDDFGTGFSSLAQMYKMPFSELKIDQAFVRDVTKSEEARVIVATTATMAHGLNLTVCAEGVEDHETYEFLVSCGCQKLQGYLISRPVPGDALFEFGPIWRPNGKAEATGAES